MAVIGISCYFHDSAAAVISSDGDILGAASEERFTRKKYDSRFPICALDYCINLARGSGEEIEAYVYYEKPIWVFMRLLETYFTTAPRGFSSFLPSMKTWISNKIFTRKNLSDQISELDSDYNDTKLFFSEHHLSHACSAFYPSPFEESAILCLDAVGEFVTTSAWIGKNNKIDPLWEINFPNSLGMLYSSFTYYCGFKVNSGEYKLMGLAPYGEPKYVNLILDNLIDIKDDGSYKLHMKYFKFHRGLRMISNEFKKLFKNKERLPEEPITQFYMDLASSIQKVTEDLIIKIANNLYDSTKLDSICLSGGVALNCVANGKILDRTKFKNIWIQPAAGDAGSSLGAALGFNYLHKNNIRNVLNQDAMKSAYLGPRFTENTIESFLKEHNLNYQKFSDVDLYPFVAGKLARANVVGWFQERMEFGPRALGNRSILGDPRIPDMQKTMNLKIKNRESFRPFAPVILEGFQKEYFGIEHESQYMLITRNLSKDFLLNKKSNSKGLNKVNDLRSTLPAITHVDNSCRVQTLSEARNSKFYKLLKEFHEITGCPVLINTSFNVRGEPIVCTPEDAFICFINTNIDILVLGNFVIDKKNIDPLIKHNFQKPYTIDD